MLRVKVILLLVQVYACFCADYCINDKECRCAYSDGSVVDLSPLNSAGKYPRCHNLIARQPTGYGFRLFSYNPCTGFTEGPGCDGVVDDGVAVCMTYISGSNLTFTNLGSTHTGEFLFTDPQNLIIQYRTYSQWIQRFTQIVLICNETLDDELTFVNETSKDLNEIFVFTLRGKHVCRQKPIVPIASQGTSPETPTPIPTSKPTPTPDLNMKLIVILLWAITLMILSITIMVCWTSISKYTGRPEKGYDTMKK